MFKAARLQKIKDIIQEQKQADVTALSSMLAVTEVTIRNDLDTLQKEGFIIKTHGGALLNEKFYKQNGFSYEDVHNISYNKHKEHIGLIAANMVNEKDAIYLGSGITCFNIAKALKNRKNINIVTNNVHVLNILSEQPSINIILTGGNFSHSIYALTGEMVQQSLKGIFIDKAFISVSGIHMQNGFTVSSLEELNVYRTIMNISRETIITADYTKFDVTSFVKLGPFSITNKVITNENIPSEYKSYFFEEGIQIFTSYDIKYSEKDE